MRAKRPFKKRKKRVARGIGSGHGKTATRGHKGQRSRSGYKFRPGFEGGQNPLYRRLPKRGFNNADFRIEYRILNLDQLEKLGLAEISPEILAEKGLVKNMKSGLKVLGGGELKSPLVIKAHRFSESAKKKIIQAGGQAILIQS